MCNFETFHPQHQQNFSLSLHDYAEQCLCSSRASPAFSVSPASTISSVSFVSLRYVLLLL